MPPVGDLPEEEMRAPTEEEWSRMTPEQRLRVEDELLNSDSLEQEAEREEDIAEGERHLDTMVEVRDTLREFFRRQRPGLFVAADTPAYYPGQKAIRPDLLAVVDVETHLRESWLVSREGKGVDLVMEIHHKGSWRRDFVDNVARYAALGIYEYFAFDLGKRELRGWRLAPGDAVYQSLRGPWGRLRSEVLGLDLMVEDGELRFFLDNAELLGGARRVRKLQGLAGDAIQRAEAQAQQAQAALRVLGTTVLALLTQRGVSLTAEQQAQIQNCQDLTRLTRWAGQATQVAQAADLFLPDQHLS